jgi:hypothetical protein
MNRITRIRGGRIVIAATAVATTAIAAFAPTFAGGEPPPPGATVADVTIKLKPNHLPKFVGPATVPNGAYLQVTNQTNGAQVGPHTFSLVTQGVIPKTKPARQKCFTPGHICLEIAQWHEATRGPVGQNPALAGAAGWDTSGNLNKKGDSWFTGGKVGNSFAQQVTAPPGTTLHYLCAVHAFMKGSIEVTAPTP